jgi:hypothetical protein
MITPFVLLFGGKTGTGMPGRRTGWCLRLVPVNDSPMSAVFRKSSQITGLFDYGGLSLEHNLMSFGSERSSASG